MRTFNTILLLLSTYLGFSINDTTVIVFDGSQTAGNVFAYDKIAIKISTDKPTFNMYSYYDNTLNVFKLTGGIQIDYSTEPRKVIKVKVYGKDLKSYNVYDVPSNVIINQAPKVFNNGVDSIVYNSPSGYPISGLYIEGSNSSITRIEVFYQSEVTDIKEENTLKLNAFPNPVTNVLTISNSSNLSATALLSIYDINGKLVENKTVDLSKQISIDFSSYIKGAYLLIIQSNGKLYQEIIIK